MTVMTNQMAMEMYMIPVTIKVMMIMDKTVKTDMQMKDIIQLL